MYLDPANAVANLYILESFLQTFEGSVPSHERIWIVVPPIQMQWVGYTPCGLLHYSIFAEIPSPADSFSIHVILKHSTIVFKLCTRLVYWIMASTYASTQIEYFLWDLLWAQFPRFCI